MRKSEIRFTITLDEENVPEQIFWNATDKESDGDEETKSINISLWDHQQKNTLRIDLWTKEMPVDEMRKFYLDCLGGMSQSLLTSTGDEFMSNEIKALCDKFAKYLEEDIAGKK